MSKKLVHRLMKEKSQSTSNKGHVVPEKHTTERQRGGEDESKQRIIVPLDVPEFEIMSQCLHADGGREVQVRVHTTSQACPRCGKLSAKIHERRKRVKRDISLRGYHVSLIVQKRCFRCETCQRPFPESENACGKDKRTTKRCRHQRARQAAQRPLTHVAQDSPPNSGTSLAIERSFA